MNPGRRTAQRATHRLRTWRVRAAALAGLCAAVLLAACGGGTSQFEPFEPEEYHAFGDESSLIRADGRRWTVNPLQSSGAVDCKAEPIWTQAVATHFSFVFAECNPDGATTFKARMRAVAGARVDDLKTQIDQQLARGGFAAKSLATVMIGAHDVLDLYAQYPRRSEDDISAELRERGIRLAGQINRLVDLGVRVVVSTVPDMGLTPYALAQKAAFTDTDRAALLTRLTAQLNGRLRVTILNDGRFVGLVLTDEAVQSMVRVPTAFGLSNTVAGVCTVALPDCTAQTLVPSGASSSYLWADDRRMAYGGQLRLGVLAVARAANNPF
jgi:hypothetical protein